MGAVRSGALDIALDIAETAPNRATAQDEPHHANHLSHLYSRTLHSHADQPFARGLPQF